MKTIKQLDSFFLDPRMRKLFRLAFVASLIFTSIIAFSYFPPSVEVYSYDKANHLIAFMTLAFFLDYSFPRLDFLKVKFLSLLLYAGFIEVVQYLIPYRTFSLLDIIADIIGIVCYLVLKNRILALA